METLCMRYMRRANLLIRMWLDGNKLLTRHMTNDNHRVTTTSLPLNIAATSTMDITEAHSWTITYRHHRLLLNLPVTHSAVEVAGLNWAPVVNCIEVIATGTQTHIEMRYYAQ